MCQKLEQERDELRADIAFLMQEYGESIEPMSKDAVELKERCRVLKERDELRKRVAKLEAVAEAARKLREFEKNPYNIEPGRGAMWISLNLCKMLDEALAALEEAK